MSIIRDVQDNNDKRDELAESIPQVDISTPPQPQQSQPIISPDAPPSLEDEPQLPVMPPDENNAEASVLRNSGLEIENLNQQTAPNFDIMPTVNEVFLQNQSQAQQVVDERLAGVPGNFVLNGDVQPSLYEVTETRGDMFSRDFDFIFPQTGEQVKKQLIKEQYTPGWGDDYDPMGTPDASSTDHIKKRGLVGLLNQVGEFTLGEGVPDGEEAPFAPFRGFRELGKDIVENPWNAWKAVFALPIGMAGGQYGEMGSGLMGSAFYNISLAQNAAVGAATDIYQAVTGKKPPKEKLNVVQGIQGTDFSFTTTSSEQKPLSFVGSKENPETYDELKNRSILWQHPLFSGAEIGLGIIPGAPRVPGVLDVWEKATDVFQTEENKGKIPLLDKLPNRVIQTQEFVAGMVADAVTDPLDVIGGIFKKAAKGIDTLRGTSQPVRQALEGAADDLPRLPGGGTPDLSPSDANVLKETRILKGDPELPSVVPETGRVDLSLDAEVRTVDTPVRPALDPDNQQMAISAALDSPNATAGQIEEVLGKAIEPPMPTVRSSIIDQALPQVDASSNIIGLLPPSNTSDDIISQITEVNTNVDNLLKKFEVNVDEFNPITRRTNSQITQDIGLNREPLSDRRIILSLPGSKELVNYKASRELPRVEFEDSFLTRLLDNATDEVIDNPNTVPDLINAQKQVLPSNYRVFSSDGQQSLAKTLRNEQVFETFAKESEELQARLVRQLDEYHKTMEAVESLEDIGRRNLENPVLTGRPEQPFSQVRKTSTSTVEIPYERKPPEFYELDEFDVDDTTRALAAEVNSQKLFHGTKTVIGQNFSEVDPILGSSRSEIGTVIHVTNDTSMASVYAEALPNRNSPPTIGGQPRKIIDGGLVYEVQPQVQNPRLVDDPIDTVDAEVIQDAVKKTPKLDSRIATRINRQVKSGRSYEDIMSKIDEIITSEFDEFPEQLALDIQRSITTDVRDVLGVDALVKRGKDGYLQIGFTGVPGRQVTDQMSIPQDLGMYVGDIPQTPIQRQAYMKYLGDKTTAGLYPNSKFSQVNEVESLVKYQAEELNLTAQRAENAKRVAGITADELLEQEQQLRQISDLEYRKSRDAKEARWKKQNERQIQSYNTVEKGIC